LQCNSKKLQTLTRAGLNERTNQKPIDALLKNAIREQLFGREWLR